MLQNFVYLSSWDEVTWCVDFNSCYINRCDIITRDRAEVRNWIETCCQSTVYCWNGTSRPTIGQTEWAKIMTPDDERCYLIFSSINENEMFLLKYADRFNVYHYGKDFAKAYHKSRN